MVLALSISETIVTYALAGEDKNFIEKFMTKSGQSIFKPALAKDIFSKDDFVK